MESSISCNCAFIVPVFSFLNVIVAIILSIYCFTVLWVSLVIILFFKRLIK